MICISYSQNVWTGSVEMAGMQLNIRWPFKILKGKHLDGGVRKNTFIDSGALSIYISLAAKRDPGTTIVLLGRATKLLSSFEISFIV